MSTPSTLPRRAVIREVGLRDGLQAIARTLADEHAGRAVTVQAYEGVGKGAIVTHAR